MGGNWIVISEHFKLHNKELNFFKYSVSIFNRLKFMSRSDWSFSASSLSLPKKLQFFWRGINKVSKIGQNSIYSTKYGLSQSDPAATLNTCHVRKTIKCFWKKTGKMNEKPIDHNVSQHSSRPIWSAPWGSVSWREAAAVGCALASVIAIGCYIGCMGKRWKRGSNWAEDNSLSVSHSSTFLVLGLTVRAERERPCKSHVGISGEA